MKLTQKVRSNFSVMKKGTKNSHEIGTAMMMLLAYCVVAARSLCSVNENASARIDTSGSAVMNPASSGFLPDSHEAKVMTETAMATLAATATGRIPPAGAGPDHRAPYLASRLPRQPVNRARAEHRND